MPRLRCPRCANLVDLVPGAAPVCLACGFTAPAPARVTQAAAPPVPPAPPATLAPPPAPAPARRGGTGKVVAITVVAALVLAGAAAGALLLLRGGGSASALSEEEAEARVADALMGVSGALSGQSGSGSLRKVTMEMESDAPPSGSDDLLGGGLGDMDLTVLYGREGRVRFDLEMRSGAVTVAFTAICTPRQQFLVVGGETYGSREAVADSGEACSGVDDVFGPLEGAEGEEAPFPAFDEEEARDAELERHGDGSVTARLVEDGMEMVVEVDPDGRLTEVRGEAEDGTFEMLFDYGARSAIPLPDDYELLPASVGLVEGATEAGRTTWTVESSPQVPPLDELEVRIQDFSFGLGGFLPDGGEARATFALVAGEQRQGNYTFAFTDADGDGRLGAGDSFAVTDLDAAADDGGEAFGLGFRAYDAVLYDKAADGAVNSTPQGVPAPGAAWLALGLAGLALALRRRA